MYPQTRLVANHFNRYSSLTPKQALSLFGCMRLASRIWDLKQEGYKFEKQIMSDRGKHWAKYFLVAKPS